MDRPATGTALASRTTLGLGGPAADLVTLRSADAVVAALRSADAAGTPVLVLGGGSNVVVADAGFAGRVVVLANRGLRLDPEPGGTVLATVEAGEDWDGVVRATVEAGLGGLECLSGIPGRAGATPVQNVGAYGVEIADLLVDVDLYDRAADRRRRVPAGELGLGYRSSRLKRRDGAPCEIVLRVRLRLPGGPASMPLRYGELAATLGVAVGERADAARVRAAVLGLRRGKGMVLDPADPDTASVGSFFTNPVRPAVPARYVGPTWLAAGGVKLSAAWLVEHAGFAKGHPGPEAAVALSSKHVLALTHRGGGTTAELLELARNVRDGVFAEFGVTLEPEPVFVGCRL